MKLGQQLLHSLSPPFSIQLPLLLLLTPLKLSVNSIVCLCHPPVLIPLFWFLQRLFLCLVQQHGHSFDLHCLTSALIMPLLLALVQLFFLPAIMHLAVETRSRISNKTFM